LETIEIYTDGSSLGNPGPGGYGIVLKYKNLKKTASKGFRETTNNRMELLAVIEALYMLNANARDKKIIIYSDSKYVINSIEKGWVFNWQKKNFKDKKNADLWRVFLQVYPHYKVTFEWVKGHSGIPENEECDKLAKKAAEGKNLKIDSGFESQKKQNNNLFS
jgi:ribonuclease HI